MLMEVLLAPLYHPRVVCPTVGGLGHSKKKKNLPECSGLLLVTVG